MITMNCDGHPLLKLEHKPEKDKEGTILPPEKRDKRTVVPIDAADQSFGPTGNTEDAPSLIQLPPTRLFNRAAIDSAKQVAGQPSGVWHEVGFRQADSGDAIAIE